MMFRTLLLLLTALAAACASSPPPPTWNQPDFLGSAEPKASVLMLGVFHFSNPGLDTYKPEHHFDAMSRDRQREIEDVVDRLARFQPTRIAVEFLPERQAKMDELYQQYVNGEHELGVNEVYQLGFRLAKKLGHPRVYLVDARARHYFTAEEYKERQAALEASGGLSDTADEWDEHYKKLYAHDDQLKTRQSLREHLLYINSPDRIRQGHGHYVVGQFKAGSGFTEENDGYFGPDSATGWYNRNLRTFRNLQRLTESTDERILLIIGAGHLPILRFLAQSSPEYELVEPAEFLLKEPE